MKTGRTTSRGRPGYEPQGADQGRPRCWAGSSPSGGKRHAVQREVPGPGRWRWRRRTASTRVRAAAPTTTTTATTTIAATTTAALATGVATVAARATSGTAGRGSPIPTVTAVTTITTVVVGSRAAGDGESSRAGLGGPEVDVVLGEIHTGARDTEGREGHYIPPEWCGRCRSARRGRVGTAR